MSYQLERIKEEQHLEQCISTIKENIGMYQSEISVINDEIKQMYEQYRDDDPEIFTELSNKISMNTNMKAALHKNLRALQKPYFGRIDIREEDQKQEQFYIGKSGVMKDNIHIEVIDWRAPVANVYYESSLGECSYIAPGNQTYTVDLQRKRTYEIEGERLVDYYDSEYVANDELLTKYLAKNKEAVLGEIIATIQKEQNEVIRKSPYRNMIVQGAAGSGKTTVAMHRISYILYNYAKNIQPEDFYIIGSNQILLKYITGVLPDLDVYGIKQMMMEQLFICLLYEDWDKEKYLVVPCKEQGYIKGTSQWFYELQQFANELEKNVIPSENIYLKKKLLLSSEQIQSYIKENPGLSIQTKINMLNERVLNKLKNEFVGMEITYPKEEKKKLKKEYSRYFGADKWKTSIYDLYKQFIKNVKERWAEHEEIRNLKVCETEFDVYDLAALAYLYKRVKETDPIREAHHIVVDEAQDYGMMAYLVLDYCIPRGAWTIMGDVSQNIHFGFGLNDWEELKTLFLKENGDTFKVLAKSYRNTVEISRFAQKILQHTSFISYPIEPIIRHGKAVEVTSCKNREVMLQKAINILSQWKESGQDTIAVITRDDKEAESLIKELSPYVEIEESQLEKAEFKTGIMVLPVNYTKGLEFDAVLIYNPTKDRYPYDDGHAKLLYVAATRALHELEVIYEGELTQLITA